MFRSCLSYSIAYRSWGTHLLDWSLSGIIARLTIVCDVPCFQSFSCPIQTFSKNSRERQPRKTHGEHRRELLEQRRNYPLIYWSLMVSIWLMAHGPRRMAHGSRLIAYSSWARKTKAAKPPKAGSTLSSRRVYIFDFKKYLDERSKTKWRSYVVIQWTETKQRVWEEKHGVWRYVALSANSSNDELINYKWIDLLIRRPTATTPLASIPVPLF